MRSLFTLSVITDAIHTSNRVTTLLAKPISKLLAFLKTCRQPRLLCQSAPAAAVRGLCEPRHLRLHAAPCSPGSLRAGATAHRLKRRTLTMHVRPLAPRLQPLLLSCLLHLLLLTPPPANAKGSHCTGERSSDQVTTYTFTAPNQVAQLNTTSFTLSGERFDLDSGAGLYHIWAVDVTQPDGTSGIAAYVQSVCSTGLPATPTYTATTVSSMQLEVWFSFSDFRISSPNVCRLGPQPRHYFLAITREDEVSKQGYGAGRGADLQYGTVRHNDDAVPVPAGYHQIADRSPCDRVCGSAAVACAAPGVPPGPPRRNAYRAIALASGTGLPLVPVR